MLDAEVGRFLSPDPIQQLGSSYAYAGGNPIDLWDPDGLDPVAVASGGGLSASEIGGLLILTGAALATSAASLAAVGYIAAAKALGVTGTGMIFIGWAVSTSNGGGSAPTPPSPGGGPLLAPDVIVLDAGSFGCSPSVSPTVPVPPVSVWLLVPFQILLAAMLVRRRRRAGGAGHTRSGR
jgi:hypothetical protein